MYLGIRHLTSRLCEGAASYCKLEENQYFIFLISIIFFKKFEKKNFFQINQSDATIAQVYYLMFIYSSTCFGHPRAHRQELQQLQ